MSDPLKNHKVVNLLGWNCLNCGIGKYEGVLNPQASGSRRFTSKCPVCGDFRKLMASQQDIERAVRRREKNAPKKLNYSKK